VSDLGVFLRNRRGRIRPAEVGLPAGTGRRQTPGLRREELATLAGVSVDYYVRLEQGRDTNPSPAVLDALATALRLDHDEREHLHRLTTPRRPVTRPLTTTARPGLVQLLATVRPAPAFVLDPTGDLLAENPEALALLCGMAEWPRARRNIVRWLFRHPSAREIVLTWQRMAEACVADLRTVTGQADALIAELCATSTDFAGLWRDYDVRAKTGACRTFQHPLVGRIELTCEILSVTAGQRLVIFQAAPGTSDHDALTLLAMGVHR
jgi:transcriptional regulator with XRE-family HTH domain